MADMEDELTAREREVAALVANGDQNKGIAHELGISEDQVKRHVSSTMVKLGVSNRAGIAAWWTRKYG